MRVRNPRTCLSCLILLTAATAPPAMAAPPAVAKKPSATKGTAQLPGDVGKVGVTYTLRTGGDSYNLTIKRFYFVATRMVMNGKTVAPEPGQKFLVLDYTVQNPNSGSERTVNNQLFRMTAVDANNQNYELSGDAENTETHQDLDISLKPGQRVEAKTYIPVPAEMLIPKLILDYYESKVMRFDLHGIVGKVEPVLQDPADTTGTIARTTIPDAKIGVTYPFRFFDVTVTGFSFVDSIADTIPDEGKRFLVMTLKAKNVSNKDDYDFNNGNGFTAFAMDTDGDKIDWQGDWFKASSTDKADTSTAPGIEKTYRLLFPVSKNGGLKTLTFFQGEGCLKLVYDVSGVK